jgi:hydrogen peroxide-dependent heme synthase
MPPQDVAEKAPPQSRRQPVAMVPPAVPLTLDGSSVLHQMFRVRWPRWRNLLDGQRQRVIEEAVAAFTAMENDPEGASALFSLLGHKGDLLVVHFRRSFDTLNATELQLAHLELDEYLEPTHSYLSVVELGLYESSVQLYESLLEKGIEPGSPEWIRAEQEKMEESSKAMAARLWPEIPPQRYLCFYPMDKKRGEANNWYDVPIQERRRMMRDHGMIGRRYAGKVKQIISGSIGFDNWEWGVDLFADDPLYFKQLIYEMRFDEASSKYALFGEFFVGLRFPAADLGQFLAGKTPAFAPPKPTGE